MFNVKTYIDQELWVGDIVDQIESVASSAPKIILSGGNTPIDIYQKIKSTKAKFLVSDERLGSISLSNYYTIKNLNPTLLLYGLDYSHLKSESEVKNILNNLTDEFSEPDLAILGFGTDYHIASIFRGAKMQALPYCANVLEVKANNQIASERVSLSLDFLLKSKKTIFISKGEEKFKILNRLKEISLEDKNIEELPLFSYLTKYNKTVDFYHCI